KNSRGGSAGGEAPPYRLHEAPPDCLEGTPSQTEHSQGGTTMPANVSRIVLAIVAAASLGFGCADREPPPDTPDPQPIAPPTRPLDAPPAPRAAVGDDLVLDNIYLLKQVRPIFRG